jgi:hypothetical protein
MSIEIAITVVSVRLSSGESGWHRGTYIEWDALPGVQWLLAHFDVRLSVPSLSHHLERRHQGPFPIIMKLQLR